MPSFVNNFSLTIPHTIINTLRSSFVFMAVLTRSILRFFSSRLARDSRNNFTARSSHNNHRGRWTDRIDRWTSHVSSRRLVAVLASDHLHKRTLNNHTILASSCFGRYWYSAIWIRLTKTYKTGTRKLVLSSQVYSCGQSNGSRQVSKSILSEIISRVELSQKRPRPGQSMRGFLRWKRTRASKARMSPDSTHNWESK